MSDVDLGIAKRQQMVAELIHSLCSPPHEESMGYALILVDTDSDTAKCHFSTNLEVESFIELLKNTLLHAPKD